MRIKKFKKAISILMAVTMTASGVMSFFPSYSYAESETVAETEMTTEAATEAGTETVATESEAAETVTTDAEAAETEKKAAKSSSEAEIEAADSNEEETESTSSEPMEYELLLPYYENCTYTYDTGKLKEAKADGSLILSYEAGEQVAFSVAYPEEVSLDEIHVYDSSNVGYDFSCDEVDQNMTVSFVMPAADTRLELAFSEIMEESDLETEAETEEAYNFIAFEVSDGGQMVIGFSDGTSEMVTSDMLSDDWDYEINFPVSEEVTISGTANDGYVLDSVVVTNENGETIATSDVLPITVVANADYKITVRLNFVAADTEAEETEDEAENAQDGSESESGTDSEKNDVESEMETESVDDSNVEAETDAGTENADEAEAESGIETELESESVAEAESEADSENENEETNNDSDEDDEFTTDSIYYLSDDEMLSYIRPEIGETVVLSAQYVYYEDTDFDYKSYIPESDTLTGATVTWESGEITWTPSSNVCYTITYKAVLDDDDTYYWYIEVPFYVISSASVATVWSDSFEGTIYLKNEQSSDYSGVIPEKVGTVLEGEALTAVAGEGFVLNDVNLGYDADLFLQTVYDDGGFDADTVGVYTVVYEIVSYENPEYYWYVSCTVTVTETISAENAVTVHIASGELAATVTDREGISYSATYGNDYLADGSIASITVYPAWPGYDDIEPELSVYKNGELISADEVIASEIVDGSNTVYTLADGFEAGEDTWVFYIDFPTYSSDAIKSDERRTEDYAGYEELAGVYTDADSENGSTDSGIMTVATTTTSKTWTGYSYTLSNASSRVTNYGWVSNFTGYRYWRFNFSDDFLSDLEDYLADYGVELAESLSYVTIGCNQQDGSHMAYSGASCISSVTITTTLYKNSSGDYYKVKIAVSTTGKSGTSQGNYQDYYGSTEKTLDTSTGNLKIIKKSTSNNFVKEFVNVTLDTNFKIYTDSSLDDEYLIDTVKIRDDADEDEESSTKLTETVALEEGTYWVVESKRAAGHAWDSDGTSTNVYKVTVTAGETTSLTVTNTAFYFNGNFVYKTDEATGEPLAGAVFKVVGTYDNEEVATWYFKTDENGYISYDENHYLSSWNGNDSDALYKYSSSVGYALPNAMTLTVTEVEAPDGYLLSENSQSMKIKASSDSDSTYLKADLSDFNTPLNFTNERDSGYLYLVKVSDNTSVTEGNAMYSVGNAVYAVKDTSGTVVATLTTDDSGTSNTVELESGLYTVSETTASPGFEKDTTIYTVNIEAGQTTVVNASGGGTVPETPVTYTLDLLVVKAKEYATDMSLSGAQFEVKFYAGASDASGSVTRTWVLQSDSDGNVMLDASHLVSGDSFYYDSSNHVALPLGYLTIEEIKAPEGYQVSDEIITYTMTADNISHTGNTTVENVPKVVDEPVWGGIAITKADSETADGKQQGDVESMAGAVYAIINKNSYAISVKGDTEKTYASGEEVMRITTNADGYAETGAVLQYGTYEVVEVTAPTGYTADGTNTDFEFTIPDEGGILTYTVSNEVIRGGFKIQKSDSELNGTYGTSGLDVSDGDTLYIGTQGDATLAGTTFVLTNMSENAVVVDGVTYQPGETIATFVTDESGCIETASDYLPYGTYNIKETEPPTGYTSEGVYLNTTFTIREDGKMVDLTTKDTATQNRVIRFDIQIIKFRDTLSSEDATDDVEPIEGVVFGIYLESTGELVMTITTNEEGVATTADPENYPYGRLPYGTYVIKELEYPDDVTPVEDFTVTGTIDGKTYSGIYKNDKPIESGITVVKVDAETGNTIPVAGTEFQILDEDKNVITFSNYYPHYEEITNFVTDESGSVTLPSKLAKGTYYIREVNAPEGYVLSEDIEFEVTEYNAWPDTITVELTDTPEKGQIIVSKYDADTGESLAGAVFAVFANEDVVTPDGTTRYVKNQYIETFTIGEDGTGMSSELYLGSYYVQEIQAPEGYCLDDTRMEVALEYADQNIPIVYVYLDSYNKPTTMKLYKTDIDELALEGVTFTVTRTGDVESTGIESESAVDGGTFVTDADGLITAKYLVSGIYEIREAETLTGYVLDETPRYVTVDTNGFIYESDESGSNLNEDGAKSDTVSLSWVNDYTKWDFSKVDVTGESEVPGATLQVIDSDGNVVEEWVSTEETHRINKLPAGEYTLVETLAPEGYVTASTVSFTVTETGEVQTAQMTDKQVFAHKVDVTGENEIPGASMTVTDSEGNIVDEWVSTEEAHAISGLKVGETYTLTEVAAPDGYVKASSIEFTVTDDGVNQDVTMVDKQVFVSKTTITGEEELPGATLTVTDSEGNVVDTWISTNEQHAVSGLEVGQTYTLTEETAPDGYVVATDIVFTVEEDGTIQTVTMVDKQLFVVKVDSYVTELAGAELEVRDADRNVVDAWTSDGTAHAVSGLVTGQTYTLVETKAPEGYAIASETTFTVSEDAESDTISLINKQVLVHKVDVTGENEVPGASMTVTDSEGSIVDEWTSTEEAHAISNIRVGETYTLTEVAAPDGYVKASSITFTVTDDGTDQELSMVDKQVYVSKKSVTGEEELEGATLTVTDSEGNVVDTWVSTTEEHPVSGLTVGETYTLTEEIAPAGYAKASSIEFTVEDDYSIQTVTMYDELIEFTISKKDITDEEELPGAQLVITDSEGNVVDEWTSTDEPHMINIAAGTYTLTETTAPDGYATAESIEFTIDDTQVQQTLTMYDAPITVEISKKDITNDEELPGAHLIVKDEDGNTVDEWTSTDEVHTITNLTVGTYTLTEITAPDGYEVAETITFEVTDTAEVQHVTMYDSPKEETVDLTGKNTTSSSSGTVTASSVKTGDMFRYLSALLAMAAGAALLVVLALKRRKRA
ncbi:MAG: hypothetical protein LUD18_02330 [Lachnospiraceae bacterium]|nr:hypothetical protein [Lachnospiraceae bacterium]